MKNLVVLFSDSKLEYSDKELFRNVLLENIDDDNIIRKYWLPFINKKLEEIL